MSRPGLGLEELIDNEDYYSLLNVSREVSQDELRSAYRRLCMIYHPDKHDEANHKQASDIFSKIQAAYVVLSDPMKRHIYDVYGKKGLEADWQIAERRKSPEELQAEYERIQRMRELQRLEERTHPKGTFSMTINATSLFDDLYDNSDDEYYEQSVILPDITKMSINQSVEAPLSVNHTATISGQLESNNGNGNGNFNVSLRKTLSSKTWGEVSFGANDSRGFNFDMKVYRSLPHGLFTIANMPIGMAYDGMTLAVSAPGANFTLGKAIADNLYGTIDMVVGVNQSMATNLVYETANVRLAGKLQFGIPHSICGGSLTYKFPDEKASLKLSVKCGTFGYLVEYGAQHQLSQHSIVSAHVNVGFPLGVAVKLKLTRASQTYVIPVMLSDEINYTAVFYGTLVPIACYAALQYLIVKPYRRREKDRQEFEDEETLEADTNRKREEAASVVDMMRESTERKIELEEQKRGLVIVESWYGRFVSPSSVKPARLVDVKIPVQNLVEDSRLQLPQGITKSGLPGFYDPCPSSAKKLKVTYKFRGVLHKVEVDDHEALRMPLKSHLVRSAPVDSSNGR